MRSTNKHKTRKPSVNPRRFFALIAMSPVHRPTSPLPGRQSCRQKCQAPMGTLGSKLQPWCRGQTLEHQSRRLLSLLPVAGSPKLSPKVPGTNGDARPETPALVPGTDARSPKPSPTVAVAYRHVAKSCRCLSPKVPGTNGEVRLETPALVPGTGRQSRRQSRRLLSLLPVAMSPKVPGTNGDVRPETPALVPRTDARTPKVYSTL
jgi:hypothetical protein